MPTDPPAFKPDTPAEIVCDWLLEQSQLPTLEQAVEWYATDKLPTIEAFLSFMRTAYPSDYERFGQNANRLFSDYRKKHGYDPGELRGDRVELPKWLVLKALDFLTIRRECRIPQLWLTP